MIPRTFLAAPPGRTGSPAAPRPLCNTVGLAAIALALSAGPVALSAGDAPAALPGWVVLVLKPVAEERVRPVTGIVLSADGLVAVPGDFVTVGDPVIVLDGGTDLAAHGRSGTFRSHLAAGRLALLTVPGLRREPAVVSATALVPGDAVHFTAFPPAEQIAAGMTPVNEERVLGPAPASAAPHPGSQPALNAPLPNVSGPVLNRCGQLVGFQSASGVQSLDTTQSPHILWQVELRAALARLAPGLAQQPCPVPGADQAGLAAAGEAEVAAPDAGAVPAIAAEESARQAPSAPRPSLPPAAGQPAATPATSLRVGALLLSGLAGAVLGALATLGIGLLRRRGPLLRAGGPAISAPEGEYPPDRRARWTTAPPPELLGSDTPAGDCRLEILGTLPGGATFERSLAVDGAAIQVLLGCGDVDVVLQGPGIRREHARLAGSADQLTLTDLGSQGETWINRVPCLPGEVMFVTPADTVLIGAVCLAVRVERDAPPDRDPNGG